MNTNTSKQVSTSTSTKAEEPNSAPPSDHSDIEKGVRPMVESDDGTIASNCNSSVGENAETNGKNHCCKNRTVFICLGLLLVATMIGLAIGLTVASRNETEQTQTSSGFLSDDVSDSPTTISPSSEFAYEPEPESETLSQAVQDMEFFPPDATKWPHLLHMNGDEAALLLEQAYPGKYNIVVVPLSNGSSMDLRSNRIIIWVDENDIVAYPPHVG